MSRYYQGTAIACKYSPEFRNLVYKINPHDMSCMYKRMFEMCATNTLRDLDSDMMTSNMVPQQTPVGQNYDKSHTVIHVGDTMAYNDIEGWLVCTSAHNWQFYQSERTSESGCHRPISSTSRTLRSQSAFAKLENHSLKDDRLKIPVNKAPNSCRKTYSTEAVGGRSYEYRLLSPRLSTYCNINSFSQITFNFQHGGTYHDYIDQYREHYTQRRLKCLQTNISEYRSYPLVLTAPPILHRQNRVSPPIQPKLTTSATNSTSVTNSTQATAGCFVDAFDHISDIRSPPKRLIKKRIWKSQKSQFTPKPRHNQTNVDAQCQQKGGLKMDSGGGVRKIFASEECISTEPEITHRLPNQMSPKLSLDYRSRPTIPSRIRGSTNDGHTYLVSYFKK